MSRIALVEDRIARVVRSPGGFAAEHDPASGDLYLRPSAAGGADDGPVTLFIGTEKGFTYRLALTPEDRESVQILIRNAAAVSAGDGGAANAGDPRVAALVRIVRAVARREPFAGYAIEAAPAGDAGAAAGLRIVETWRGPRFTAHVAEVNGAAGDAAALAGTMNAAAAWLGAPGTGPAGGRIAVVVIGPQGDGR